MAKQFYENRNPNDLKFLTRFECGNEEKRRWNGYLSSENSDTDINEWREEKGKITIVNTQYNILNICVVSKN
jgi:hypothetical protein